MNYKLFDMCKFITKNDNKLKIYKEVDDKYLLTSLNMKIINNRYYLLYTITEKKKINHFNYYYNSKNIINEFLINEDCFNKDFNNKYMNHCANFNFFEDNDSIIIISGFIDTLSQKGIGVSGGANNPKVIKYGQNIYLSKIKKQNNGLYNLDFEKQEKICHFKENTFNWIELTNTFGFVIAETRQQLLKFNNIYYLFLRCNRDRGKRNIYLLKSKNLIVWTDPVLIKMNYSINYNFYYQNIWIKNNKFYGLFTDNISKKYYSAVSNNGIDWKIKEVVFNGYSEKIEIASDIIEVDTNMIIFYSSNNKIYQIKIPIIEWYNFINH